MPLIRINWFVWLPSVKTSVYMSSDRYKWIFISLHIEFMFEEGYSISVVER